MPNYEGELSLPLNSITVKKLEEDKMEILETFKKVQVNIPLLDAIKQITKYSTCLKDLCTHMRNLKGHEKERFYFYC